MSAEWVVSKEEDEAYSPNYEIMNYPADTTLQGYFEKYKANQLQIPEFQRKYVWDIVKASKLIESFLLGLPVPGVFLYKSKGSSSHLIIDGQQRIFSAVHFLEGNFRDGKSFKLKNVKPQWEGKTFKELNESDRFQLENTVLRSTIIQQIDPKDDSSIYHIFERLNTGGVNLTPMEIRNCVYSGPFIRLLTELNQNPDWREIIGKKNPDERFRDIELILRIFALSADIADYEKPMKGFLNQYINKKKNINEDEAAALREKFIHICSLVHSQLGKKPFHLRGPLNYSVLDSIMPVIMMYGFEGNDLAERYNRLKDDPNYINAVTLNTSDTPVVKKRFEITGEHLINPNFK